VQPRIARQALQRAGCSTPARKQCDYPVKVIDPAKVNLLSQGQGDLFGPQAPTKAATCDAWICDRHAKSVGADRDYCPPHAQR
jgi:hypothetical protein